VEWTREGVAFPPPTPDAPDDLRALRPWVLQEAGDGLRITRFR
jgi:hypothetical protein